MSLGTLRASVLITLESYDSVKGLRLPNPSHYLNNTCEKSLKERTSRSCHSICEQVAKCIARRHGSSAHETVESLQDLVVRFLKTIWTGHLGLFGGCPSCIMVVSDPSTAHASTLGRFGDFCRLASLWLRPNCPGTGLFFGGMYLSRKCPLSTPFSPMSIPCRYPDTSEVAHANCFLYTASTACLESGGCSRTMNSILRSHALQEAKMYLAERYLPQEKQKFT